MPRLSGRDGMAWCILFWRLELQALRDRRMEGWRQLQNEKREAGRWDKAKGLKKAANESFPRMSFDL